MTGQKNNSNHHNNSRFDYENIYQTFMSASNLQTTTQEILDLATHLTGAENCSLMLLNGHDELYVLNSRGLGSELAKSTVIKVGEGIAGQVAKQGDPLLVEDIEKDERYALYKRSRYRTGSFIACPITSRERTIGVLNLNDKRSGEPFKADDLDQARLISLMAAVALRGLQENKLIRFQQGDLEEIYRRLVEAESNKRAFVARIAHDMRTPLNNIRGAAYFLKSSTGSDQKKDADFYEIIEKEVDYLISYLDEGIRSYEMIQDHMQELEERKRYSELLE